MSKEYLTEDLLTVYEAAQALGKTNAAARNPVKTGGLESVKVLNMRLVPR